MKKKTNPLVWLVPALLVYAAGFVVATVWDLALNQAVYSPKNFVAVFMECFGWYPAFLPTIYLALLLAGWPGVWRTRWWQAAAGYLVAAGGLFGIYYASYGYLEDRGWLYGPGDPTGWLWLGVGVLFGVFLGFAALRTGLAARKKLVFFGAAATVYLAANQAVTYLIKLIWARTRFDDMVATGSFDAFTPWYRPFGHGGSSFPSGHTANAAGIFVLLILCDLFAGWAKRRRLVTVLCWVWIAAMAAARVLIGRHFLSDTLAASGVMALLFLLLRHSRPYKQRLAAVLADADGGRNAL